MQTARTLRLRESIPALRVLENAQQPVYQRLEAGTVLFVIGEFLPAGLVNVSSATDNYTVFAEDLLARSEPVGARAAVAQ
jgi:hypothetical protein